MRRVGHLPKVTQSVAWSALRPRSVGPAPSSGSRLQSPAAQYGGAERELSDLLVSTSRIFPIQSRPPRDRDPDERVPSEWDSRPANQTFAPQPHSQTGPYVDVGLTGSQCTGLPARNLLGFSSTPLQDPRLLLGIL